VLRGLAPNTDAIGAIVDVHAGDTTKRRLVRGGSNYASQDPPEAHVGLGDAPSAPATEVHWPDGTTTSLGALPAGATFVVNQIAPGAPSCGSSTEDACDAGGSKRKVDCLIEWKLPGVLPARKGSAVRKVSCTEGDPDCDVDPDIGNGECHIRLVACLDVPDARVRDCAPAPLASVVVDEPAADATDAIDLANRNALLQPLRVLGLGIPGFANATPNHCVEAAEMSVPLRRLRSGRFRPGRRRIRIRATTATGLEDLDTVVLRCRPSSR
jgi:hypothetical protein